MAVKSQQELYESFLTELQSQAPDLTDENEGSNNDILAGVMSTAINELSQQNEDNFRKTFFDTAHGPEVTGGPDDLQFLALDHFGDDFKRPGAVRTSGVVTFSRPNADTGSVLIPVNTVVKTQKTSAGNAVSYKTVAAVVLTGTSINASVLAVDAGPGGNVNAATVNVIETSLSDTSVTVTNANSFNGGKTAENDAEYRLTIKRLLQTLKGATVRAIESKALTIPGVVFAKAVEMLQYVIEWDIVNEEPVGSYFKMVRPKLYIADSNGVASSVLVKEVKDAMNFVRAAGIEVQVIAASAVSLNWSAEITLNPSGPHYGTLQTNLSLITDAMTKYLQDHPVGFDFVKTLANNHIMALFGPMGTNDITVFQTLAPAADVATSESQKIVPGTVILNGN